MTKRKSLEVRRDAHTAYAGERRSTAFALRIVGAVTAGGALATTIGGIAQAISDKDVHHNIIVESLKYGAIPGFLGAGAVMLLSQASSET